MEDLYETEDLFRKDLDILNGYLETFQGMQGNLSKGAKKLYEVLSLYERMNLVFERLYVYANQKNHEDTANPIYQKMSGEMQLLAARLGSISSYLEPEILAIPDETLQGYMQECEELSGYRRFLYQITRQKEHILSAKDEEMLSKISDLTQSSSNIFAMFNNADIRFPMVEAADGSKKNLTIGTYISYMESKDRTLRKNAFEALYGVYQQHINTLAATYYANAKQADFFARERHYENARDMALSGSNIPGAVYEQLIDVIGRRMPVMHRYVALRKRMLQADELHMYDIYVPIVDKPEKSYSFDEAKAIVKRGLAPLGEDYLSILQDGFDHRWIDVYENEGKRTGAYSWGAYGTHPYVLLNYHGSLNDVFTLAHEMGHALHSWHSDHAQSYLDAGYKIFVAEVASTCNEALLIRDLLNRTDDKNERMYLINYFLDQFKGTMFRQTMFAEFEMITHDKVHAGEVLTADELCGIYLELNKKYFGADCTADPEIAFEWARIPHFYTPFYVYQYATGFAAAIAISSKILKGEEGIVEKYKRFLSGGGSLDPIDLLRICDVDMESAAPVEEALDVFEAYVAELEKEL